MGGPLQHWGEILEIESNGAAKTERERCSDFVLG